MQKESKDIVKKHLTNKEIQLALIENFVNLQKVLTNLSIKFDGLSDNITRLLQIFEISAKSFIRKNEEGFGNTPREDKELLNKLDSLVDQNKTIARGLTLIEEKIRHKIYGENVQQNPVLIKKLEDKNRFERDMGEAIKPKPLPKI
jgi:seryl-tRNA synthetase